MSTVNDWLGSVIAPIASWFGGVAERIYPVLVAAAVVLALIAGLIDSKTWKTWKKWKPKSKQPWMFAASALFWIVALPAVAIARGAAAIGTGVHKHFKTKAAKEA